MKSAEDWWNEYTPEDRLLLHPSAFNDLCNKIQLDAYKSGLLEAAEIVRSHVHCNDESFTFVNVFKPTPLECRDSFELAIRNAANQKKDV